MMNDDVPGTQRGPNRAAQRALEILNAASTADSLKEQILRLTGSPDLARLAPALHAQRERIGGFLGVNDLADADGVSAARVGALIDGLNQPSYDVESETLQKVVWAHGASLELETPEAFPGAVRRADGIYLPGQSFTTSDDRAPGAGLSRAHISIPVAAWDEGRSYYVKSVLLNFHSFPVPMDVMGRPVASPYGVEVWDGHVRLAPESQWPISISIGPDSPTRYYRVPVESGRKLQWGLSVSLELYVIPFHEGGSFSTSLLISAVGVELVTRTGLVVARP